MAKAQRNDSGQWTILPEEGDHDVFNELLSRQLNALDPIFEGARQASQFEFIMCLLRVRGMQDGGWEPWETTLRAVPKIRELADSADTETSKHLALWLYGHVFEASEPYELLANLLRVAQGGRYQIGTAFPLKGNRPASPGEKIAELSRLATEAGFPDAFVPLKKSWDRQLRNAAFHADYTVTRTGLRILDPMKEYTWDQYNNLINAALAYHTAFAALYKSNVSRYDTPIQIAAPVAFSRSLADRAVVMVREGHGVIGMKDSWSQEQIRQGSIPWRIGRFSKQEMKLINDDPMRALFPVETEH